MGKARTYHSKSNSEVRFWACFAVVFALFSQALFPVQVMAKATANGTQFVLCTDEAHSQPVADVASAKLFKSLDHKKSGYQGLKCASCVLASITAVSPPAVCVTPIVYQTAQVDNAPAMETSPVKARAPPRPHSCGPPAPIEA